MTPDWTSKDGTVELYNGDTMEVLPALSEEVSLIATDPPYYKVKGEAWDRQWDTSEGFISWLGDLCNMWHDTLAPNGSLYVFASPKMAARVEVKVGETFSVLNRFIGVERDEGYFRRAVERITDAFHAKRQASLFDEEEEDAA